MEANFKMPLDLIWHPWAAYVDTGFVGWPYVDSVWLAHTSLTGALLTSIGNGILIGAVDKIGVVKGGIILLLDAGIEPRIQHPLKPFILFKESVIDESMYERLIPFRTQMRPQRLIAFAFRRDTAYALLTFAKNVVRAEPRGT